MKDDDQDRPGPDGGKRFMPPWWAEDAPDDAPLPDGFPERPDQHKVDELRSRVARDKSSRPDPHRTKLHDRLGRDAGRSARDIGNYTLIPMMMLVGPVLGYLAGHWVESRFGGAPWPGVGGVVFGLAAAVRQIVIMLGRRNNGPED